MKNKIILLLLMITFNAEALYNSPPVLEEISLLANQSVISYEEGIEALLALPGIFSDRNFDHIESSEEKGKQLKEWKTLYNNIHNKLFVLTHIARIRHQILSEGIMGDFRFIGHEWQTQAHVTRLRMKRTQLQDLEQALDIISAEDFKHSEHEFQSLSDIGKIYPEESMDTDEQPINAFSFSKSFSKKASRVGLNPLLLFSSPLHNTPIRMESLIKMNQDVTELIRVIREAQILNNASQRFISKYRSAQAFDMSYRENTSLPEESFPFLNRLDIDGPTPYFAQNDLSRLYKTAPSSQAKSKACVGFSLASDMELELQKANKLKKDEALFPFSVYTAIRYQEDGIQAPDCPELHSFSDIVAEGAWERDRGITIDMRVGMGIDTLTNTKYCLTSSAKKAPEHTGYVSIKNIEIYDGEVTFDLLKAMIDHRRPPVLIIKSDSREEVEDWINPNSTGSTRHALVVVGYGTNDIDPFSLRQGPYFLVRDSLASHPIHYKVSAKDLLDNSLGILKISQLERYSE
ncbi:MAG: hypothetical protein OXM55_04485 [Bdellovibrionales bacterium]|nr:hypothetical protein [Bdellovibrionales bacterium]